MKHAYTTILAALAAAQLMAGPVAADEAGRRISVSAEGRVEAAPDMATISLGVVVPGDTAAAALRDNSARLAAVIERLRAQGIAARDLQTSGLTLGPQYHHSSDGAPPRLTGYEAGNQLTVQVRDLARLGEILDAAVGEGADRFHGLSFAVTEPAALLDAARLKAVAEARRRAEQMATAAGARLGPVLEITDEGQRPAPRPLAYGARLAMAADAVPVEPGEVSYTVAVRVVWALAD